MSRLVTGLFYTREEAENALRMLQSAGLSTSELYLEQEVSPGDEVGRKGGEISRVESERRIAGLETGIIIGMATGLLAGWGLGTTITGLLEAMRANADAEAARMVPYLLTSPLLSAISGLILGGIVGALIGWVIDSTLDRLGAGPARPMEETLVTVRTTEERLQEVYAALFNARARHLHVSDAAAS